MGISLSSGDSGSVQGEGGSTSGRGQTDGSVMDSAAPRVKRQRGEEEQVGRSDRWIQKGRGKQRGTRRHSPYRPHRRAEEGRQLAGCHKTAIRVPHEHPTKSVLDRSRIVLGSAPPSKYDRGYCGLRYMVILLGLVGTHYRATMPPAESFTPAVLLRA